MTASYNRATSGGASFWRDNEPEFVSIGEIERITGNDTRILMVSHSYWPITPFRFIPAFIPRMIPWFRTWNTNHHPFISHFREFYIYTLHFSYNENTRIFIFVQSRERKKCKKNGSSRMNPCFKLVLDLFIFFFLERYMTIFILFNILLSLEETRISLSIITQMNKAKILFWK